RTRSSFWRCLRTSTLEPIRTLGPVPGTRPFGGRGYPGHIPHPRVSALCGCPRLRTLVGWAGPGDAQTATGRGGPAAGPAGPPPQGGPLPRRPEDDAVGQEVVSDL